MRIKKIVLNCVYENCDIKDCCLFCKYFKNALCNNGKSKLFKQKVFVCAGCKEFQKRKDII
jgi:hypothetical protein